GQYDVLLWSLYTASVLISNSWYNQAQYKKLPVSIKIPKQTKKKVPGILTEMRHISNFHIQSKHENLSVNTVDDVTSYVKWEDLADEFMYLQLFDGSFSTPPSEIYKKDAKVYGNYAQ